jgi:hypothetical protein
MERSSRSSTRTANGRKREHQAPSKLTFHIRVAPAFAIAPEID